MEQTQPSLPQPTADLGESPMEASQVACTEDAAEEKIPVTVEVCLRSDSVASLELVHQHVESLITTRSSLWYRDGPLNLSPGEDEFLERNVEYINICDTDTQRATSPGTRLLFWQIALDIHVFQLNEEGVLDDDEGEDQVPSYREWLLPARDFDQLWESLMYESSIKSRLLSFAASALQFADAGVSPNCISWNRTVLLHGPPGTGKTSLCKALAQKLSIRMSHRYTQGQLVEVNAHSLFSKWFSESGKLVSRLFAKITERVEEEDCLVFVLIDEVESLTAARKSAVAGSEPADAIRAVNALLTQLDGLKRFPNVMILTTSNITEAIDLAFVDRADIKAYIGPPNLQARYEILRSCIAELQRVGIVTGEALLLPFSEAECGELLGSPPPADMTPEEVAAGEIRQALSAVLVRAAAACDGLSGRTLRKLPFLAHANAGLPGGRATAAAFIRVLEAAAVRELQDQAALQHD